MAFVYILKCSDNSYEIGSTNNLERRLWEPPNGFCESYTSERQPVELVWSADFPTEHEAFLFERQIKGWSRAKKEALIRGNWEGVHQIAKRERKERETSKGERILRLGPLKRQRAPLRMLDNK